MTIEHYPCLARLDLSAWLSFGALPTGVVT